MEHTQRTAAAVEPEIDYAAALNTARRFLAQWRDPRTENDREDLAQEAVIALWLQRHRLQRVESVPAFVCTVARRLRGRALRRRRLVASSVALLDAGGVEQVAEPDRHAAVRVGDCDVEREWLLATVCGALPHLPGEQRAALAGYYGGQDTASIAGRCGLPRRLVKLRLHRGRNRLRRICESRIAVAMRLGERHVERVDGLDPTYPRCRLQRAAHNPEEQR